MGCIVRLLDYGIKKEGGKGSPLASPWRECLTKTAFQPAVWMEGGAQTGPKLGQRTTGEDLLVQ